jgi:23S rRNA (cytosine1962-C5)-methyltransferase
MRYPELILKRERERSLQKGHPWLFSGAIARVNGHPQPGDIVSAVTHSGEPVGLGFYNPATDISFRLLTAHVSESIDDRFWEDRICSAFNLRQRIVPPGTTAYRLINAEGDCMPGLIVDRYDRCLVVSLATAGVEKYRSAIVVGLIRVISPGTIYERSEGKARQLEGLSERKGLIYGEEPPGLIEIRENGLTFAVDVVSGQKTGFFLDQRKNRECIEKVSKGAKVLNCFSYTGAFSVYAIRGGAEKVTSVDVSAPACDMARDNLSRNGYSPDRHPVVQADVFSYLRETEETFDLIILDPPAFAKSKKDVPRSARGYKDINLQAVRRLSPGGLLATFSCSNYIGEELFGKIVAGAVLDTGKEARLIERLGPGGDHAVNLAHPEGRYLKGLLLGISG